MPTYEYECQGAGCGKISEEVHRIHNRPFATVCPACGDVAIKIISRPAVFRDDAAWINDGLLNGSLQDPSAPKIETRTDLNKFLRANPDIVPVG